jgi:hypothetical protein
MVFSVPLLMNELNEVAIFSWKDLKRGTSKRALKEIAYEGNRLTICRLLVFACI